MKNTRYQGGTGTGLNQASPDPGLQKRLCVLVLPLYKPSRFSIYLFLSDTRGRHVRKGEMKRIRVVVSCRRYRANQCVYCVVCAYWSYDVPFLIRKAMAEKLLPLTLPTDHWAQSYALGKYYHQLLFLLFLLPSILMP